MGFETNLFVQQPVDENLLCSVCHGVQEKPMVACENAHTFCVDCLVQWELHQTGANNGTHVVCPDCRTAMLPNKILNRPLHKMIHALIVRCPEKEQETNASTTSKRARKEGDEDVSDQGNNKCCEWQGTLSDYLEKHRENECEFRTAKCPLQCGTSVVASQLKTHKETECINRNVTCNKCMKEFPESLRFYHEGFKCSATIVPCRFCGEKMPRGSLGRLSSGCPAEDIPSGATIVDEQDDPCTGHYAECPNLVVRCAFVGYGCPDVFFRKDLDKHHAERAARHAELVANKFKQLESNMEWRAVNLTWKIQVSSTISQDKFMQESGCYVVGEWKVFLRFIFHGGSYHFYICVHNPNCRPDIDRVNVTAVRKTEGANVKIWGHWPTEVEFKKDGGDRQTWSLGGVLQASHNGGERSTPATPADLRKCATHGLCIMNTSFRLRAPQNVEVRCHQSLRLYDNALRDYLH